MDTLHEDRYTALHLLRAGHDVDEVSRQLKHTVQWVRKWHRRFKAEGWSGLEERSRSPRKHGTRYSDSVRQDTAQARSELEAAAEREGSLKYVGALAVRTRLKEKKADAVPSVSTVERILREKKMTRPYRCTLCQEPDYPHLHPSLAHQLCQVDIVPHFLDGGQRVSCFNAIDVVSRYPTGRAYRQRRSQEAAEFLVDVWQTIGIPQYTQVDNDGCFSGGSTHPYVLGKVVRLALQVGTELVFSPVYHPQSNGFVERFHQEYNRHVWEDTYLDSLATVQEQAERFFSLYRDSRHHSALQEQTPAEVHYRTPVHRLAPNFAVPSGKLPLHTGHIHFMRLVQANGSISVLNVDWQVPNAVPNTGVWATIEFRCEGATLSVYDTAPDAQQRTCLVTHPFPLSEPVHSRHTEPTLAEAASSTQEGCTDNGPVQSLLPVPAARPPVSESPRTILTLLLTALARTARSATKRMHETMY